MIILIMVGVGDANSGSFVCSGISNISRPDMISLYSGEPIRYKGKWVKVFIVDHLSPSSKELLASLGMSGASISRLSRESSIVPRDYTFAPIKWHDTLIKENSPAIGMSDEDYPAVGCVITK